MAIRQLNDFVGIWTGRKSPERLTYSRRRLILAIVTACLAAYLAHSSLLGLNAMHALMKIVCELAVLVIGLRFARTTSTSRYRQLVMTYVLFLVSLTGDALLWLLSFIPIQSGFGNARQFVAFAVMTGMAFGAVNAVRYGLSVNWRMASAYVLGYIALAVLLYEIVSMALPD